MPSEIPSPPELARELVAWIGANVSHLEQFSERADTFEDSVGRGRELQRLLWDEGWTKLGWPEEVGGRGGSVRHRAVIYECLAEAGLAVPEPYQILEVAGSAVIEFAPHLACERLAPLIRGDEVWSLGFSEPDAGSDLGAVRTQLSATPVNGEFRLNGLKTWNGLGHLADYSIVLCRSVDAEQGRRDLTMALVHVRGPGVSTRPIRAVTGVNEYAEMFLDDVVVRERELLGGMGAGWSVIGFLMQYERGTYAWPRQARLHRLLEELSADGHLDRPGLASRVGALAVDLAALRLKCRQSLALLADPDGDGPGPDASMDKLLLVRAETALMELARDCLYPAVEALDEDRARKWRNDYLYTRALSIFGGTNEIQRNIVAERVLNMPRERAGG